MKLIMAIIMPLKLEDVCDELAKLGIWEIVVTEAKVHGRQRGHAEVYRGAEYGAQRLCPRSKSR